MKPSSKFNRSAFTLVEIMTVVSIVGILAVIGVSRYMRTRQVTQGRALVNDARIIDHAIDQWAIQYGITTGTAVNSASISVYLKQCPLKSKVAALGSGRGSIKDVLKVNTIEIRFVGSSQVIITASAKSALPAVTNWGGY